MDIMSATQDYAYWLAAFYAALATALTSILRKTLVARLALVAIRKEDPDS